MEDKVEYCRNCKRNIAASNYVIHSVHCERNIQLCNLCQEPVPRSEVEKHLLDYHSIDPCSNCGVEVEKCQLEKHKEVCIKRLVSCKFCNLDLPLDQHPEHIAACGSRTEKCLRCHTHVMIKDQEEHQKFCMKEAVRIKRRVSCKFCDFELSVDELHEHIVACGSKTEKCLQCNKYVMIRDLEEHSTFCMPMNNGIKESISCDYCGGLFPYNHLNDHKAFCGARTEKCERCKKWVMLKDQGKHLSECGAEISSGLIPCEYCKKLCLPDHYPEHAAVCLYQLKCGKCGKCVKPEDRAVHFAVCNEETVFKLTFPCEYCDESISEDLQDEHVITCRSRTEKCEKCKNYVLLKDKGKHRMTCQTVSKTFGKCPVCHENVPWVDMNVHQAACAQIQYAPDDYVQQNEYNELALKKGSRDSEEDFSDEIKSQRVHKICSFCAVKFPSDKFAYHLNTCKERPYNCKTCLKAMPYKEKEKHNQKCHLRVRGEKQHSNKFILQHEDAGDGAQVMKKCSFCDERLPDLIFKYHFDICAKKLKKCDFCSDLVPAQDIDQHAHKCTYRPQKKYSEDGVGLYGQAASLFPDTMKFTKCQYCGDRFTDLIFKQHVPSCPERHKKCDFCFDSVAGKDMDEHLHKCRLVNRQGNPYSDDDGRWAYADDILVPSKKYEKQKYLEENIEKCPSCNLKIPESKYHQHLRDCYAGKRPCKFCGVDIPYGYEHAHFQNCKEFIKVISGKHFVSQSRKRENTPSNNKRNESFIERCTPGWFKNIRKGHDKCEVSPVQQVETVPLLPCEFCEELYPFDILIEHQSGCRPDLVSFPQEPAGKPSTRNTDKEIERAHPEQKHNNGSNKSDLSVGSRNAKTMHEWKQVSSKKNNNSLRKPSSWEKMENSSQQMKPNAKSKYFFFQPSENAATAISASSNGKKRYPQLSECPESSKVTESKVTCAKANPAKELPKKHNFTSYKFSTVPDTKENDSSDDSKNNYDLKRKFDYLSKDARNQHQLKSNNSYSLKVLTATSDLAGGNQINSPIKSEFTDADMCEDVQVVGGEQPRVLKAVGAERAEKKGIIRLTKDSKIDYSASNENFENYSINKQMIFGHDKGKENPPFDFCENIESSKSNLNAPAIWNTDYNNAKNEEAFGSEYEKFLDDNHSKEAENSSLSKTKRDFSECENSKQEDLETSFDGFNDTIMQENDVDSDLNAYFRYLAKDTKTLFRSVDKSQELATCVAVNCDCGNEVCFCALTKESSSSQDEISWKANALEDAPSSSIAPDLLTNDCCPMNIEPPFKEISTSNQIEKGALEKLVAERPEYLVGDTWKKWRNKKSADTSDSE